MWWLNSCRDFLNFQVFGRFLWCRSVGQLEIPRDSIYYVHRLMRSHNDDLLQLSVFSMTKKRTCQLKYCLECGVNIVKYLEYSRVVTSLDNCRSDNCVITKFPWVCFNRIHYIFTQALVVSFGNIARRAIIIKVNYSRVILMCNYPVILCFYFLSKHPSGKYIYALTGSSFLCSQPCDAPFSRHGCRFWLQKGRMYQDSLNYPDPVSFIAASKTYI